MSGSSEPVKVTVSDPVTGELGNLLVLAEVTGEDPYELPDLFRAAGDWMRRGPCRRPEVPSWLFFPADSDTETIERAKAVCTTCPVQAQCAAAGAGQEGIWGGLTEAERLPLAVAS